MTPQALDGHGAHPAPEDDSNRHRETLAAAIPAISRPLLKAQLDEVDGSGALRLNPVQLERAREISRRWADDRIRFEQAVADCRGGLGLRLADGVLADLQFLDAVNLGCRLEALVAVEALAENQPAQALAPLAVMLSTARVLAAEWNVTTRMAAASLRAEALQVLDAVANHQHATRETHERLLAILENETAEWPSDALAWIGDRATGLIAYELVRDGYYLSLLDQQELQKLREDGLTAATAKAVMRNLDRDELFYLHAMRRMIDACQQPYFERASTLTEIRHELAALEQSGDYPLVAGRLLLNDFETVHRRQAEDLARCVAWKAALAAASGRPHSAPVANPLTGQPLQIQQTPTTVQIDGVPDQPSGVLAVQCLPMAGPARISTRIE